MYFALLCFALLCFALLYFALLYFALLTCYVWYQRYSFVNRKKGTEEHEAKTEEG